MKTLLVFLMLAAACFAADYYVATNGNDTTGDGTIGTPWATIQKGIDNAYYGDTVYIRAGTYHEELVLKRSGQDGLPITISAYNGETVILDGASHLTSWTQCASDEAGLTRGGSTNANATSIYKTSVLLTDVPWKNQSSSGTKLALFNDGVFCELAMNPDTGIMIGHNTDQDSWTAPDDDSTSTAIHDASGFTSNDSDYYDECLVLIYVGGNAIQWKYADSFNTTTDTITLSTEVSVNGNPVDLNASNLYAVCNNPMDIDAAGEYSYTWTADGQGYITIYYYANNETELSDGSMSFGTYNRAIDTNNYDYIVINGLEIRNYCQSTSDTSVIAPIMMGDNTAYLHNGWEIKYCNIHDFAYEYLIYAYMKNCYIHNNTFSNVGFGVNGTFILSTTNNDAYPTYYCDNVRIYDNTFSGDCQSTGIRFLVTRNSAVYHNTFTFDTGNHGNGMSFYQGCYNCVFAYNYSAGKNIRLTIQDVGDQSYAVGSGLGGSIYVYSNIFQTSSEDAQDLAWWIDTTSRDDTGSVYILNNLFTSGGADNYALYLNNNDQGGPAYVYNNIIEYCEKGAWAGEAASVYSHNIHFGFPSASGYSASDFNASGKLENDILCDGSGENPDHSNVLANFTGYTYANGDYAVVDDGQADAAGVSIASYLPIASFDYINFYLDIAQNPRSLETPCIGPLEFVSVGGSAPTKANTPSPANSATGISVIPSFSWVDGGNADSYDFYWGPASPLTSQNLKASSLLTESYTPTSSISYNTTAYWRVDSKNAYGTTTGDTWSFTTVSSPPVSFFIPDFVGYTQAEAQALITLMELTLGTETWEYNSANAYGIVISQDPDAHTDGQIGQTINLTYSQGPIPTSDEADGMNVTATVTTAESMRQVTFNGSQLSGSYEGCIIMIKSASTGKRSISQITSYNTTTNTAYLDRDIGFTPQPGDTVLIGVYIPKYPRGRY